MKHIRDKQEAILFTLGGLAAVAVVVWMVTISQPRLSKDMPEAMAPLASLAMRAEKAVIVQSNLNEKAAVNKSRARVFAGSRSLPTYLRPVRSADSGLPSMLTDADRSLYQRAFALQESGEWAMAQTYTDQVINPILIGHLQAQKFLHKEYTSGHPELVQWLKKNKDLPQAKRIHRLMQQKAPNAGIQRVSLKSNSYLHGYGDSNGLSGRFENKYARLLDWQGRDSVRQAWHKLIAHVKDRDLPQAFKVLTNGAAKDGFTATERDLALLIIAEGYFRQGLDLQAIKYAGGVAKRSGDAMPAAYWIAGLASWRLGKLPLAADYFGLHAESEKLSGWERAAGAYWAYRANRNLRQTEKARGYLRISARYHRTFYGILARASLGQSLDLNLKPASFNGERQRQVVNLPAVRRAIALAEIGYMDEAERELRTTFPQVSPDMGEGILMVAQKLSLPAVQMRMAQRLQRRHPDYKNSGKYLDFAKYPVPNWKPENGYNIDPALIFAVMRQESGFNTFARSHAGARGLMQLMPGTAKYIAKRRDIPHNELDALYDPTHNMMLGQAYVEYLMAMSDIRENLVYMLSAYNAGPGNLIKWRKNISHGSDPLLFMESIPITETRNYVSQVITNYWIYREILGQPNPSLEAMSAGRWPRYEPPTSQVASLF